MKDKSMMIALLAAILINLSPALAGAESPERLARPHSTSTTGSGGSMVVSGDPTIGNMVVDQYAALGRKAANPDSDPKIVAMMTKALCSGGPIDKLTAYAVGKAMNGLDRKARARLKVRDDESMTGLATRAIATLDGVDAGAILADEAIGPGAYHDAIGGMRLALDTCHFFGLEAKL